MGAPRYDDEYDRRSPVSRRLVLTLAWALATLIGLLVATETKIGPTVLVLSRNHGVHLGDVLAFAGCYAFVLLGQLAWPRR